MNSLTSELASGAKSAMSFSYSPYSSKKIGACLALSNGRIYSGCNIENASYGGTVCAERVAIWKAFSENPSTLKISEIVVISDAKEPWPPCGFCRQVMAEFSTPETKITLINLQGNTREFSFNEIFPEAFGPASF